MSEYLSTSSVIQLLSYDILLCKRGGLGLIWLGKSDEGISVVALRGIFMYEMSMSDFLLKNEKRRVHKFLNKSRKLRGGVLSHPVPYRVYV